MRFAKKLSEEINEMLRNNPPKRRITWCKASRIHDESKKRKNRKERRRSKQKGYEDE